MRATISINSLRNASMARAGRPLRSRASLSVRAEAEQKQDTPSTPSTPDVAQKKTDDELPPWVRREREREAMKDEPKDLPFGVYLLFSSFCAIAAIGSIFEYSAHNAIFGVIQPDNFLYTPILGFFAITGLPTAGFLFFKSVTLANKLSEAMDKADY